MIKNIFLPFLGLALLTFIDCNPSMASNAEKEYEEAFKSFRRLQEPSAHFSRDYHQQLNAATKRMDDAAKVLEAEKKAKASADEEAELRKELLRAQIAALKDQQPTSSSSDKKGAQKKAGSGKS